MGKGDYVINRAEEKLKAAINMLLYKSKGTVKGNSVNLSPGLDNQCADNKGDGKLEWRGE